MDQYQLLKLLKYPFNVSWYWSQLSDLWAHGHSLSFYSRSSVLLFISPTTRPTEYHGWTKKLFSFQIIINLPPRWVFKSDDGYFGTAVSSMVMRLDPTLDPGAPWPQIVGVCIKWVDWTPVDTGLESERVGGREAGGGQAGSSCLPWHWHQGPGTWSQAGTQQWALYNNGLQFKIR